jgi:uncharacterized protein YbaR (Trm112 family)/SAM-dependent methyltransferase
MPMDTWMLEVVACPLEGSRLAVVPGGSASSGGLEYGMLACHRCQQHYPVFGGVPILVPQPQHWVSAYHDAVLAALSEAGRVSRKGVELVNQLATHRAHVDAMQFGDDWVEAEILTQHEDGVTVVDHGAAARLFASFVEKARGSGPRETLLEMLDGHNWGTCVEVGSGAGTFARSIRKRARRYVVCDLSLRAVFNSLHAARRTRGSLMGGAVVDADRMRLRSGSAHTIVAAQLVDLLEHPVDFFQTAAQGLAKHGRLALITPSPDLDSPDDDEWALRRAVEEAGFEVQNERDGVPWIREHSARYFQVFFALAMIARKR